MPVYKPYDHYIMFKKAFKSILAQTYQDLELLIILDGYDQVAERHAMAALNMRDDRVRLFVCDQNNGPGIARNIVYRFASGDFITFHDSDDYSHPERFEKLINEIDKSPVGVVASHLINKTFNPFAWAGDRKKKTSIKGKYTGTVLQTLLDANKIKVPFHFPSCVLTRDFFEMMGGYEPWKYSSDSILAIKIGLFNDLIGNEPIHIIKEPIFTWKRRPLSITMSTGIQRDVFHECQTKQREPIFELREKIIKGDISFPMSEEQALAVLDIKNNLNRQDKVREVKRQET